MRAERTDSAGVEIVVNAAEDRPIAGRFVPDFDLGGKDLPEESFYRVYKGMVGTDEVGRIYVLDANAYQVVAFDANGEHLWSAGQQGEGPGELGYPGGMVVTADGEALVLDFSKRGFVAFRDGEPGEPRSLPFPFFGGTLGAQGEDLLLLQSGSADAVQRLVRLDPSGDTAVVRTRQGLPFRSIELRRSCTIGISGMSPLFDPQIRWDARGEQVAVAAAAAYRVEVYRGHDLVRVIRRGVAPRPADQAAALAEVGEGMRVRTEAGDQLCDPAEVVEQRGFAEELPWIEALALAPDGTLWVHRFEPGQDAQGAVDLFDESGAYDGTLLAGTPFPLAFLPDGRLLVREVDEATDVQRIVVGRLVIEG